MHVYRRRRLYHADTFDVHAMCTGKLAKKVIGMIKERDAWHVSNKMRNKNQHVLNGNTEGVILKGMNMNGLKGAGRLSHILTEACRHRVGALFGQEHNFEKDDESFVRRTARSKGFVAVMGWKPTDVAKGGTCIFLNKEILGLFEEPKQRSSHGGRVVECEVTLFGRSQVILISVYVPAQDTARGRFVSALAKGGWFGRGA